jgi:hypothetical protein
MCPHTCRARAGSEKWQDFELLLYMCPHTAIHTTAIYVSSARRYREVTAPHTKAMYVFAYQGTITNTIYMCPHFAVYASSYLYICVLICMAMHAGDLCRTKADES